ncbi:MAG: hypothetical protein ACKO6E_05575 [Planctomycetota bacterium]
MAAVVAGVTSLRAAGCRIEAAVVLVEHEIDLGRIEGGSAAGPGGRRFCQAAVREAEVVGHLERAGGIGGRVAGIHAPHADVRRLPADAVRAVVAVDEPHPRADRTDKVAGGDHGFLWCRARDDERAVLGGLVPLQKQRIEDQIPLRIRSPARKTGETQEHVDASHGEQHPR